MNSLPRASTATTIDWDDLRIMLAIAKLDALSGTQAIR